MEFKISKARQHNFDGWKISAAVGEYFVTGNEDGWFVCNWGDAAPDALLEVDTFEEAVAAIFDTEEDMSHG